MWTLGIFVEENNLVSGVISLLSGGVAEGVGLGLGAGLTGRSSMPHFGQRPRLVEVTSGCIGHA